MKPLRSFLPFLIAALISRPLSGADAPTAEEWNGVEQALKEESPDASAKLSALVAAYPRWSDGQRTLAQVLMRQGKFDAALAAAKAALAISPADASAGAVAIQALGALDRPTEAFALADQFVGDKDPQGWVNFRTAEVALNAGDRTKADLHLSLAGSRAKRNPPAEFAYLDARISAASGDLDRAEVSLNRALASSPRLWDAWHALGVVQLRQADAKTASTRREYLEKAAASFSKVTTIHPTDALAWLGLGRAQVTLAQELLVNRGDQSKALAFKAITSLKTAVELNDSLRDAHLNLGVALLVSDQYDPAIIHLRRARDLGSTSRTLGFNLMLAYQKAGRTAEFEDEAKNIQAISTAEKLTAGVGFHRSGNHALAVELLASALPDLTDGQRVAATHRYIGHAHAAIAADLKTKSGDPASIDAALDDARDAWRKAGNLKDYSAQRFFMAQETARSPEAGYAAGWQHLAWHGYTSMDGWSAVAGNYGSAMTGGQGLAGMWARNPLHVVAWGVLALIPLYLAIAGVLRPKRDDEVVKRPLSEPVVRGQVSNKSAISAPAAKTASPGNRAAAPRPPQPTARPPQPAPSRPPQAASKPQATTKPPATRPPAATPVSQPPADKPASPRLHLGHEQSDTELSNPISGNALERGEPPPAMTAETDRSLRPAKAPEKQVRTSGEFAALERRTPRPEDGKKF